METNTIRVVVVDDEPHAIETLSIGAKTNCTSKKLIFSDQRLEYLMLNADY